MSEAMNRTIKAAQSNPSEYCPIRSGLFYPHVLGSKGQQTDADGEVYEEDVLPPKEIELELVH
jgi:hypothetical protein